MKTNIIVWLAMLVMTIMSVTASAMIIRNDTGRDMLIRVLNQHNQPCFYPEGYRYIQKNEELTYKPEKGCKHSGYYKLVTPGLIPTAHLVGKNSYVTIKGGRHGHYHALVVD